MKLLVKSLIFNKRLDGESVPLKPEAGDKTLAAACQTGFAAVLLAGEYIGDVNLHHRRCHRLHGISKHNGGVGISPRIENDTIVISSMNATHNLFQCIRLEKVNLHIRKLLSEPAQILLKGNMSFILSFTIHSFPSSSTLMSFWVSLDIS